MRFARADPEAHVAPILVLGIGNSLLADDGVGLDLLELVRPNYADDRRVEFMDGGTQGILLVNRLEGRRSLVLLDAVQRGAEPGHVHVVRDPDSIVTPRGFGAHGGNASELLTHASLLGVLPEQVLLVGVEPAEMRTRLGLSPAVRRVLPAAVYQVRLQLYHLLADLRSREAPACTS